MKNSRSIALLLCMTTWPAFAQEPPQDSSDSASRGGTIVANATARVRRLDDRHRSITLSGEGWTTFESGPG